MGLVEDQEQLWWRVEVMEQHCQKALTAVLHDHKTLAKPGIECCNDRVREAVKAGHCELMQIDKILFDVDMFHLYHVACTSDNISLRRMPD